MCDEIENTVILDRRIFRINSWLVADELLTEVVCGEMGLETLRRLFKRVEGNSCVVYQNVDLLVI